jgi:uroporphyrinogen-III synthase
VSSVNARSERERVRPRERTVSPLAVERAGRLAEDRPLAGFTIGITADRRRDELAALLERRGARTVLAPVLRIVPISDDTQLRANTAALVRHRPTVVVASTGIGVRGWLEAAEGWGLAEPLHAALAGSYLVARGAKARGALRAAGLVEAWSPESESGDEVLEHLLARGVDGERVAVQLHGDDQPDLVATLRGAGADVVEVGVYRWGPPDDLPAVRRLVDLVLGGGVDAVTFTSAPAVEALLRAAGPDAAAVLDALRFGVLAGCVGPVTAAPLVQRSVPVVQPGRARLGALAHELVAELPRRAPTLRVAGRAVTLRGYAAVVDGELRPLAQAPMAVLRALARADGHVLSRAQLLSELPRGCDEHAVEMAVARLRTALGGPDFVQTVVKRGYRLRMD